MRTDLRRYIVHDSLNIQMRMGFVITGEGDSRRKVAVGDHLVIGRAGDNGLVLADSAASRRHAEIERMGQDFLYRDLGSSNGTKVNNRDTIHRELKHGDLIRIGQSTIRFIVGPPINPEGRDPREVNRELQDWIEGKVAEIAATVPE